MQTTLTIDIAGLCLIVPSPTNQTLYVLMPNAMMGDQCHCPIAWPWSQNTGGRTGSTSIHGKCLDLTGICAPGNLSPLASANFSYYADTLEPQWQDCRVGRTRIDGPVDDPGGGPLAARIMLPYGVSRLEPFGAGGEVVVEGTGGRLRATHYGGVRLQVTADENLIHDFDIDGTHITAIEGRGVGAGKKHIYVLFANTMPSSLRGAIPDHFSNDRLPHLDHYYALMGEPGTRNPPGPKIYPRADSPGNGLYPKPGEDSHCDELLGLEPPTLSIPGMVRTLYIDPYSCAVGFADPPT